ncbi:MAG: cyclic nucleotide-binding domain-containing protein [Dehalococcoidia bacterium]
MKTEPNAGGDTATHHEESHADQNRSLADALRSVPIFAQLSEADMLTLASAITVQSLEKGEMLFEEGDTGDAAYVIESGALEVLKSSGDRQILLNALSPGDVVGEMALIDNAPRMAGVRASEATTLHVLSKGTFDSLLEQSASAAPGRCLTSLSVASGRRRAFSARVSEWRSLARSRPVWRMS